jgi:hypothetical protein
LFEHWQPVAAPHDSVSVRDGLVPQAGDDHWPNVYAKFTAQHDAAFVSVLVARLFEHWQPAAASHDSISVRDGLVPQVGVVHSLNVYT